METLPTSAGDFQSPQVLDESRAIEVFEHSDGDTVYCYAKGGDGAAPKTSAPIWKIIKVSALGRFRYPQINAAINNDYKHIADDFETITYYDPTV